MIHLRWTCILLLCCAACGARATQSAVPASQVPATETATAAASPEPVQSATASLPAPTASRVPAPRTFSETFDGGAANWTFQQAGSAQPMPAPAIRDGFIVFDLPSPNQWAYALYGGAEYADVAVEARAQYRTAGDGSVGLICRYDARKGWYELDLFADHTYALLFGRWLSAGVAGYSPLDQGQSSAIQADENTLRLECVGSTLTPFVNGLQLTKWPTSRFPLESGEIGLVASSFENAPVTIAFDSVKVSEP